MSKRMVSLEGAAPLVVADLMKDKENQALVRDTVTKVVDTGTSIVKWIWVSIGIVAGGGIIIWGISKLGDKIDDAKKNREEKERLDTNKQRAKSNLKKPLEWFPNAIEKLKSSMGGCKAGSFNKWGVSYNNTKILSVLKELECADDWLYLCAEFGLVDGHSLADWLGCDGSSDIEDYNSALRTWNVQDSDQIHSVGLFAGVGNLLIK